MRILMDVGLVTIGAIMGVTIICILKTGANFDRDMERFYQDNPKVDCEKNCKMVEY